MKKKLPNALLLRKLTEILTVFKHSFFNEITNKLSRIEIEYRKRTAIHAMT